MKKAPMNNKNKVRLFSVGVIFAMVLTDQIIKHLIDLYLRPVSVKTLIPGFLQLHYFENDGAMMGLMSGKTEIMTAASVVCMVGILAVLLSGKFRFGVDYVCLVFMAAGGFGNIIDRAFRGYVIDYIEVLFVDFYIFNFADCLVTCSAFVIIFYEIYSVYKEYKTKKEKNV
ncbi:MAG: signal peptidase II [Ruminococcaceae bacterium]|nr:signal peptidase II [Oscillospiraceae bacterium]